MNAIVILFYNAPMPPVGMFDEALNLQDGMVQVGSMSFLTLLNAGQPRNTPRRFLNPFPITFSI